MITKETLEYHYKPMDEVFFIEVSAEWAVEDCGVEPNHPRMEVVLKGIQILNKSGLPDSAIDGAEDFAYDEVKAPKQWEVESIDSGEIFDEKIWHNQKTK